MMDFVIHRSVTSSIHKKDCQRETQAFAEEKKKKNQQRRERERERVGGGGGGGVN